MRKVQEEFSKERNWDQYHSPRNILLAMIAEVGEVSECFQWKGEVKEGLPDISSDGFGIGTIGITNLPTTKLAKKYCFDKRRYLKIAKLLDVVAGKLIFIPTYCITPALGCTRWSDWTSEEKTHLGEELSDVLIYLVRLADRCRIDLPSAVLRKVELNKQKYPASRVYGKSDKYTAYTNTE